MSIGMLAAISPLESISLDVMDNYSNENSFEDINFDDLFVGFDDDSDGLPDLELDPGEILGEFTAESGGGEELGTTSSEKSEDIDRSEEIGKEEGVKEPEKVQSTVSRRPAAAVNGKNSHGKRKVKVDWTPELHRRFVQAVEQLGVDKAVPSRILEIMGIDCLTRHNIASHLQKYRSHRKHLFAKEVETSSWSQRRPIYGGKAHHGGPKREMVAPWLAPTMGFPPPVQSFRPLHVWGHPTVDHTMMHVWPKHLDLVPSQPPLPQCAPQYQPSPPPDPSFWHHLHYARGLREGWVANAPIQGTPYFPPQPLPPQMRFPTPQPPPVQGIPPPHPIYRPDNNIQLQEKTPQFDMHPSKESIDAAIGDVLSKPWLPLPLRLKPPSVDSVVLELQRQGIPKIPPSSTSSSDDT